MQSHIVVGLAFGDEGKGSWVDHLVRKHNIRTVVRFNGGAQARHHVTTKDGRTYGFSQFGSGTFVPSVRTLLSRYMLIEPLSAVAELQSLHGLGTDRSLDMLLISGDAPIIPYSNVLLNRIMETGRGSTRHGSCGLGIGLTQGDVEILGPDALYAKDLVVPSVLREKLAEAFDRAKVGAREWESEASGSFLRELHSIDVDEYAEMLETFAEQVNIISDEESLEVIAKESCVFEGAQGVLLDQYQGFFPHCTRSTTTPENARRLLTEAGFKGDVLTHGLLRAYGTRHGAGPFPTEDATLSIPACDNTTGAWQGVFRIGWFDAVLARYALQLVGEIDHLAITNLDRLDGQQFANVASGYANIDRRWCDPATHTLSSVCSYEESRIRTEALLAAQPIYEQCSGWENATDLISQEKYIDALEAHIGHKITALSRTKDHEKIYRAT